MIDKKKKSNRRKKSLSAHHLKPIQHYNTIGILVILALVLLFILVLVIFSKNSMVLPE